MKGDIAVAGLMITAEEWQALDAASRAQLVAVITRQDPSGGVVAQPALASGTLPPTNVALADGTNPIQLAEGTNPAIAAPDLIEELPSGAVSLIES